MENIHTSVYDDDEDEERLLPLLPQSSSLLLVILACWGLICFFVLTEAPYPFFFCSEKFRHILFCFYTISVKKSSLSAVVLFITYYKIRKIIEAQHTHTTELFLIKIYTTNIGNNFFPQQKNTTDRVRFQYFSVAKQKIFVIFFRRTITAVFPLEKSLFQCAFDHKQIGNIFLIFFDWFLCSKNPGKITKKSIFLVKNTHRKFSFTFFYQLLFCYVHLTALQRRKNE